MPYQSRGLISCVVCGNKKIIARKLCALCYDRAKRSGTRSKYPTLSHADVFETRIKKAAACWLWTGNINEFGYGIFIMPGERAVRAHRYSYEFYKGKIPKDKIIMHTCDNPPCVNPAHLQIGTRAENNRDATIKRRYKYGDYNVMTKFSDETIVKIRNSKLSTKEACQEFRISETHYWRIRKNQCRP